LADVDAFVGAGEVEGELVAAEDDVAEGHGGCAAGEEGAILEKKGGQAAVDFKDAVDDACTAAGEEGGVEEEEAEEGGGGRPEVEEKTLEGHRGVRVNDEIRNPKSESMPKLE